MRVEQYGGERLLNELTKNFKGDLHDRERDDEGTSFGHLKKAVNIHMDT